MIDLWEDNGGQLYLSADDGTIYAGMEVGGTTFRQDAEALATGDTWDVGYDEGEEPDLTPSINMRRVASYDAGQVIVYGHDPYHEPIDTSAPQIAARQYLDTDWDESMDS